MHVHSSRRLPARLQLQRGIGPLLGYAGQARPAGDSKLRAATAMSRHDAEWASLAGPWHLLDAQWLHTLQIRGRHPPNCPLRLQNLLPDVRMHELQGRLSRAHPQSSFVRARLPPRVHARTHARCNPSHKSVYFWLTAIESLSSFCIPPAFIVGTSSRLAILTGLSLQLVLCEVCCFPLTSVDGGIAQVPAPWSPPRLCATDRRALVT